MKLIEFLQQPWPWYVSGVLIALVMVLLIYFGKKFGFSSNLQTICAICGAGKVVPFFNYDWKRESWNLLFLVGAVAGGFIARQYLASPQPVQISPSTIADLQQLGFTAPADLQPDELYGMEAFKQPKTVFLLFVGGLLIGFGTRWAGGCTSGHSISGLSHLQLPSLIATIGFFIGGLIMTWLIYPLIF